MNFKKQFFLLLISVVFNCSPLLGAELPIVTAANAAIAALKADSTLTFSGLLNYTTANCSLQLDAARRTSPDDDTPVATTEEIALGSALERLEAAHLALNYTTTWPEEETKDSQDAGHTPLRHCLNDIHTETLGHKKMLQKDSSNYNDSGTIISTYGEILATACNELNIKPKTPTAPSLRQILLSTGLPSRANGPGFLANPTLGLMGAVASFGIADKALRRLVGTASLVQIACGATYHLGKCIQQYNALIANNHVIPKAKK
ncbi:MAG TPA: hypothetical protein VGT41_01320 [Candidatus Babeliales bacterium]|nr:hypothetical protein [Candidatus Babeliales bacterium]